MILGLIFRPTDRGCVAAVWSHQWSSQFELRRYDTRSSSFDSHFWMSVLVNTSHDLFGGQLSFLVTSFLCFLFSFFYANESDSHCRKMVLSEPTCVRRILLVFWLLHAGFLVGRERVAIHPSQAGECLQWLNFHGSWCGGWLQSLWQKTAESVRWVSFIRSHSQHFWVCGTTSVECRA